MSMKKFINAAATVCAVLCLTLLFFAAGFVACAATPVPTRLLAQAFATDTISPYTHDELVESATAIYDYAFGSHDADSLAFTIDALAAQAQADGRAPQGTAGEEYRLDAAALAHLDDCYALLQAIRIPLLAVALLAVAATAHVGVRMGRESLGRVLFTAGALTITVFVLLGIAALIDFDGFFTLFHGLFFAQGTWTFWYRSLLICSLPLEFWMGMGAIWFATTLILSILSCCVGTHLKRTGEKD